MLKLFTDYSIDPFNAEDIQYENGLTIVKNSIHELPSNGKHDSTDIAIKTVFSATLGASLPADAIETKIRKMTNPIT